MKTKRGIYYNLKNSEYKVNVKPFTFVFSSQFYLNKFEREMNEEIKVFNEKANNVYKNKFELNMETLALLRLYKNIEKRGFYILLDGSEVNCLEEITLTLHAGKKA